MNEGKLPEGPRAETLPSMSFLPSAMYAVFLAGLAGSSLAGSLDLPNPGFEEGLAEWSAPRTPSGKMNDVSAKAAKEGKAGLEVTDADGAAGSELASAPLPAKPGAVYEVSFFARYIEGEGLSVYLVFTDEDRRPVPFSDAKEKYVRVPKGQKNWEQYTLRGVAPEGAAFVYVRIHSASKGACVAQLDDFQLVEDPS